MLRDRLLVDRVEATSPGTDMLGIGWIRGTLDIQEVMCVKGMKKGKKRGT